MQQRRAGSLPQHPGASASPRLRASIKRSLAQAAAARGDPAAAAALYQEAVQAGAGAAEGSEEQGEARLLDAEMCLARAGHGWLLYEQGNVEVRGHASSGMPEMPLGQRAY